jgi:feruloyl esterase
MKNHCLKMGALALGMMLALAFAPCLPASAQTIPGCTLTDLQALAGKTSYTVTITSATPADVPSTTIAFCDVRGNITTEDPGPNTVEFELGLPVLDNGRFLFLGGGGFNGYIPAGEVDDGVSVGFATAYTDSGHESFFASIPGEEGFSSLDGSWGLLAGNMPNTPAQVDFSYRGVHASTVVAQSITAGYYSMTSSPISYFDGCSTGGREALVEAQKFPDDYNGIVAGDPAISDPIAGFNWNDQALLSSFDAYLSNSAVAILDAAVTAACDGSDGVIDGLIEDPRLCKFNPASIECKGGATSNCLTAAQVATVRAIQKGARAEDGTQLYPGYTLSNPGGSDGWDLWITGFVTPTIPPVGGEPWGSPPASLATAPFQWSFQDQFLKYFVFNDPTYNSLTFDFNGSDVAMLEEVVARYGGNGENTDLSPFFANGGKLIMYHGWSDPALTPFVSVDYYSAVAKTLGGGFKHLQKNARLFMVPGMHHCTGGPGPYNFDPLTPLVGWVETGVAPDRIIGEVPAGPQAGRTFPLCPFPSLAVYKGGGVDDAANWVCKTRSNHRFSRGNSHEGHQH